MSEIIEKTFEVASPAHLNLENIRGSVEIHPGEDGSIHVTATKDDGSGNAKQTVIEFTQETDGTVKVATRFPEGWWSWLWGSIPCKVAYVVQAPPKCSLKVNSVSGSVKAGGFVDECNLQSVSGALTLLNLSGPVKVKSVSGNIELSDLSNGLDLNTVSGKVDGKRISGNLRLKTVSGRVELNESSLPSIEASTVSGNMLYQTALGDGPYHFNAVSGDVELHVPPETHCSAELRSVSGKLSTKIPATSTSQQNANQTAEIQGGGSKVTLQSVSGNLVIGS
jgi:DUF4097 and DUF4098 domain-containing protein YvlB